ncbi:hypothetical protein [Streptomyces sp. HSG2]|uniref:hypothetical protein n=1 Tax=Streptomyces sp. HSG2 TaxID=2797167 RepID=UPI001F5B2A31|nr:hypothetical protein [Streptomyces sp. HSG2]
MAENPDEVFGRCVLEEVPLERLALAVVERLPDREGVEYQKLAVVGASDGILPRTAVVEKYKTTDSKRYERELKKSRNQLFVATTRARDALRISWHGKPSPFLPV